MSLKLTCLEYLLEELKTGWKLIDLKENKATLQNISAPWLFKSIYLLNDVSTYIIDNSPRDGYGYSGYSNSSNGIGDAKTEFSSTNYSYIDGDDNYKVYTCGGPYTDYAVHRFDNPIDEEIGDIIQIDILVKGYARTYWDEGGGWGTGYYLYVKESGIYVLKDSHALQYVCEPLTAQYTSNFSNIISGGHIHWGVRSRKGSTCQHHTCYAKVTVTYTSFPTQYAGLKARIGGVTKDLCLVAAGQSNDGLRIRKGGTTYDIYLVATDDPDASTVRICVDDVGTVKSIRYKT